MSLYLSDISQLIRGIILTDEKVQLKLTILGTSMGGVLAMYLTQIFGKKIYEIILNDIALTVNWTSLYSLYKSMKNEIGFREAQQLAKDLRVDERAISDVQLPGHFDLSYRADIWGMNFHEALEKYKGKVGLIYGGVSKICTQQRVEEAKSVIPKLSTLEVAGSGHPAPFNLAVCGFIQSEMGV
jgi:pimeloyl-ACP methyl ester carboxylesterase